MFYSRQTVYDFKNYLDWASLANGSLKNAIASVWMHIGDDKQSEKVASVARSAAAGAAAAAIALILLAGCASPGPPLPPTLNLPAVVSTGLTATRVGDEVKLHWTTPPRTTDKLLIKGPITAVLCRETVAAPLNPAGTTPCSEVLRLPVTPGVTDAADPLPAALTTGPARPLAYRVQLFNAAGRTAGPSPVAYAAAGPRVDPVENFRGKATKAGVVLEWKAEQGSTEAMELDRTVLEAPAANPSPNAKAPATPAKVPARAKEKPAPGSQRVSGLPGLDKEPQESRESRLRVAAETDAGGTIDRSARIGYTYGYTAQRVRSVTLAGQTLEVRSVLSAQVTVPVQDVFPPDAPTGLVTVPGLTQTAGQQAAGQQAQRPAIDLSWEPNMEPRIVGYRIYRRDLDGVAPDTWLRLNADVVPTTSYRDPNVAAGQRYAYRVTAVSQAGNESAPSDEVSETAPTP
jgi:hypothetical protein